MIISEINIRFQYMLIVFTVGMMIPIMEIAMIMKLM